jgi:HlyD family secretion protein
MIIPGKRKLRFISSKRIIVVVFLTTLLSIGWLKLNAFGSETSVSYDDLIIASVEKGDLVREVRAPGVLVPIKLNYISATSNGRVKEILFEAGDPVEAGTLIMTFDNPELFQAVDIANYDLEVQQATYHALEQGLQQKLLEQRITIADLNARYEMAKLRRQANQRLLKTSAVSDISYNESVLLEQQLKVQHQLEIEGLQTLSELRQSELAVGQAKIKKAKRQFELQKELVNGLSVRATTQGILQEVLLEEGELVMSGTLLARIAEQDHLKAELRVQESQVKDIVKGQSVVISASGKTAEGVVKRINPAVQQGTVVVDVYFTEHLLEGARPDLRINGVIELQKIKNVLKIKRPVFAQESSTSSLFVLNQAKTMATRRQVEFGLGSVDVIEIRSTLNPGDKVIVSSMSEYNNLSELNLHAASH